MPISRVNYNNNLSISNIRQTTSGQLTNNFRHLLQSIKDGNLAEAQNVYDVITRKFPEIYQKLKGQLTQDYNAIGLSLRRGDISGAQHGVVHLQQHLQNLGRTDSEIDGDRALNSTPNYALMGKNIIRSYDNELNSKTVGSKIDVIV